MKESLQPGLTFEFTYTVPENKTVPYLYPEAEELQQMPSVFATGYMVGLVEWACIQAINPHIEWPREQTVGTRVDLDHTAATPPGFTVTVRVTLRAVEGRKLSFDIEAHDDLDRISRGTHDRFVINAEKFNAGVSAKAEKKT